MDMDDDLLIARRASLRFVKQLQHLLPDAPTTICRRHVNRAVRAIILTYGVSREGKRDFLIKYIDANPLCSVRDIHHVLHWPRQEIHKLLREIVDAGQVVVSEHRSSSRGPKARRYKLAP